MIKADLVVGKRYFINWNYTPHRAKLINNTSDKWAIFQVPDETEIFVDYKDIIASAPEPQSPWWQFWK